MHRSINEISSLIPRVSLTFLFVRSNFLRQTKFSVLGSSKIFAVIWKQPDSVSWSCRVGHFRKFQYRGFMWYGDMFRPWDKIIVT
ncbi:unnamed protein product [Brugia timori]|uniref:Ovule protein n=1 Tax=Brugia timori TaxID=42155 RepID=A0A0R3R820_9BILA|nr:unnamed protein product [Brugia timori]